MPCPSATFSLQHGGFVPLEWLAAKDRNRKPNVSLAPWEGVREIPGDKVATTYLLSPVFRKERKRRGLVISVERETGGEGG